MTRNPPPPFIPFQVNSTDRRGILGHTPILRPRRCRHSSQRHLSRLQRSHPVHPPSHSNNPLRPRPTRLPLLAQTHSVVGAALQFILTLEGRVPVRAKRVTVQAPDF